MRKWIRILLITLLVANLLLCISISVFAKANKGIESKIALSMGWEWLEYEEHEGDTGIDSHAEVNNRIVRIEGIKRWKPVFCGIKDMAPLLLGDNEEKWSLSGTLFQTNSLEYRWIKVNGFIGYPWTYWLNPYGGLRWAESRQERTNFIVSNIPVAGTSIERVKYWSLLLGLRGAGEFTSRWGWNYWIEYFFPLDVEVTNSALSGFKASDKDGYTLEVKAGIDYLYSENLSFGLMLYGGRMHWNGSDWKPYANGLAKWPENDTEYLGGLLNIGWTF